MAALGYAIRRTNVERMLKHACALVADSELLSGSLAKKSDGDYLLSLLAFEILLKATLLAHIGMLGKNHKSHSYCKQFDDLPADVRSAVVKTAVDRMSTSADYSDISRLLCTFKKNFTSLRYPYEAYENLSAAKYAALGKSWMERGAPEEEATFVYYQEELFGLTHALELHLQAWLNAES